MVYVRAYVSLMRNWNCMFSLMRLAHRPNDNWSKDFLSLLSSIEEKNLSFYRDHVPPTDKNSRHSNKKNMLRSNALVVFVAYSSAFCNRQPSSHSNKRACISQLMLLLYKTRRDSARSGSNLVSFLRFVSIANAARVGFSLMAAFFIMAVFLFIFATWQYSSSNPSLSEFPLFLTM